MKTRGLVLWAAIIGLLTFLLRRPRVIRFVRSRPEQADSVFAFIASQKERNLMKRDVTYFRDAAKERRLIHVQQESGNIVGAVSFARELLNGGEVEYELTGLLLDRKVRGYRIAERLLCVAMIYHQGQEANRDRDYVAHVVDGNQDPLGALTANGFRYIKMIHVPKGALGGALDDLAKLGSDYIVGHRYEFDIDALNSLILTLDKFISDGLRLPHRGIRKQIRVALDPALVNIEAIRAHAAHLRNQQPMATGSMAPGN